MRPLHFSILLAVLIVLVVQPLAAVSQELADLRLLPPVDEEVGNGEFPPSVLDESKAAAGEVVSGEVLPGTADVAPTEDPTAALPADDFMWYDWLVPTRWDFPDEWENSFEVGIDGSEGNSTTLSLRTGANVRRKKEWSDLKIALNYVKASADYLLTKHNGQLEIHHDWLLGESPWSLFAKSIFVYDEFRPYDAELTLNAGVGYRLIKSEATTLTGRFGSGASRKFGGEENAWAPEAMFGADFEHRISDRQKFRATIEYYPEWGDFSLYRIRTDAGWEALLDERTNMSLKLGVIDRYDTRDSGAEANALDYTLLLLWKL